MLVAYWQDRQIGAETSDEFGEGWGRMRQHFLAADDVGNEIKMGHGEGALCPCQPENEDYFKRVPSHKQQPVFPSGEAGLLSVRLAEGLDGLALQTLNFRDGETNATPESRGGDFTLRTPATKCYGVNPKTGGELARGEEDGGA